MTKGEREIAERFPEARAFQKAIEAEPGNYLHRYVFADWLDEHDFPEEAARQRKFEAAERFLVEFASRYRFEFRVIGDCTVYGYGGLLRMAACQMWGLGRFATVEGSEAARSLEFWESLSVVSGRTFHVRVPAETVFRYGDTRG